MEKNWKERICVGACVYVYVTKSFYCTWNQHYCKSTILQLKKKNLRSKWDLFYCSAAQSCLTLCDPMDHSTPGFPVLHCLPEFVQTHVHRVSDAIQPFHPHCCPLLPSVFTSIRVFSDKLGLKCQSIGASAWVSVFPVNIQGWFPLGLPGLILLSQGHSRAFNTTAGRQVFRALPPLW